MTEMSDLCYLRKHRFEENSNALLVMDSETQQVQVLDPGSGLEKQSVYLPEI